MPGQQLNWSRQALGTSFVKHFHPTLSSLKGAKVCILDNHVVYM